MKKILITGCSSGFGLEMVGDLLDEGYFVIATLRKSEERRDIFKEFLEKYPDRLKIRSLDITSKEERENIVKFIETELNGSLDVLINNAGIGFFGALEDMTEDQIREQMEVNFFGSAFFTRDLLPFLRDSQGKVIFISSLMGRYSCPLGSVYSASKYALEGLIEGLKFEVAPFGVEVCSIAPGGHRTNFIKSVVWAEDSENQDSAYFKFSEGFKSMMKKLSGREKAPMPNNVSGEVTKLIQNKSMPRIVMIGNDAKAISVIQKVFPRWLYQKVLTKSFQVYLGK